MLYNPKDPALLRDNLYQALSYEDVAIIGAALGDLSRKLKENPRLSLLAASWSGSFPNDPEKSKRWVNHTNIDEVITEINSRIDPTPQELPTLEKALEYTLKDYIDDDADIKSAIVALSKQIQALALKLS